jgi:CubicO group peptidase (beta-lactamase class C family)
MPIRRPSSFVVLRRPASAFFFVALLSLMQSCGGGSGTSSTGGGTGGGSGNPIVLPTEPVTGTAPNEAAPKQVSLTASSTEAIGLNGKIVFTVSFNSDTPASIQWRRNGLAITNATSSTYSHTVRANDVNAVFDVVVSNQAGNGVSSGHSLKTVIAPAPADELPRCHTNQELAASGTAVPALQGLENAVRDYIRARRTPAASLTVRHQGVVIYERGFGWQDLTCTQAMAYDGLFRSASLAKPLTATMVRQLIADGHLQANDKVFCLPDQASGCLLDHTGTAPLDSRVRDITVQHLLDHRGGWDQTQITDPMFDSLEIAYVLGIDSPASIVRVTEYMLGKQTLQYAPGSTYAYSNFGYALLARILAAKSGLSYFEQAQQRTLSPLGISSADFKAARSLPEHRDPREPWYSDPRQVAFYSVFNPNLLGKFPDIGLSYEEWGGPIGWVFNGRSYSRFMRQYGVNGQISRDAGNWYFTGTMPGTYNLALSYGDLDIVYLSNQRQLEAGGADDEVLLQILLNVIPTISNWPTTPPAGHAP